MKLTWIGGATCLFELGAFRVLGDPVWADSFDMLFSGETRRVTREALIPDVDLTGLDLVLATCFRPDHFDPGIVARVGPGVPFVAPAAGVAHGFSDARFLSWGESVELTKGGETLSIHAVPAVDGNGYFFRHAAVGAVVTAYWTGDARWSDAVRGIQKEHGHANVLIQHIGCEPADDQGSRRTPDAKEAMQFVYRMQPNAVVAIHHHTFSHYREPLTPFVELIGRTIYETRLRVLSEGDAFEK